MSHPPALGHNPAPTGTATIEIWYFIFQGLRPKDNMSPAHKKQVEDRMEALKKASSLLWAGHFGICLNPGPKPVILGFRPCTRVVNAHGPGELVASLLAYNRHQGAIFNDTAIFEAARTEPDMELYYLPHHIDASTFKNAYEVLYNSPYSSYSLDELPSTYEVEVDMDITAYSFPNLKLRPQLPPMAARRDNCETYPRTLGLWIPNDTGDFGDGTPAKPGVILDFHRQAGVKKWVTPLI